MLIFMRMIRIVFGLIRGIRMPACKSEAAGRHSCHTIHDIRIIIKRAKQVLIIKIEV